MNVALRLQDASIRRTVRNLAAAAGLAVVGLLPTPARAVPMVEAPTFVNTEQYLRFTIDHHFSALRLTELAAGTASVGSTSNFAGAPDVFPASLAKATDPVALQIATEANAAQRMEIIEGQNFLRTYYGIDFVPTLQPVFAPLIATLDAAASGNPFNIAFLETFTGHHASLIPPSQQCTTAAPQPDVRDYCASIVESQTRQINQMRAELASVYGITNIPFEMISLPNNGAFPSATGATLIPEPASAAIFAAGMLGLGVVRSKRVRARRGSTLA